MSRSPRTRRFVSVCALALLLSGAGVSAARTHATALPPAPESAAPADPVNAKPVVVPALQTWTGGTGALTLRPSSKIVVTKGDAPVLAPIARRLVADLRELTGLRTSVSTAGKVRTGDVLLSLDPAADVGADTDVARAEGYTLAVKDFATVEARTGQAVFWGTRTLLQITEQTTRTTAEIPRGRAVDWPNYAKRGFMLDVGRRWFGHEFIRDYVRYMSWYKLNTFQIHLNDNEIQAPGGDWSKAQSAFRLRTTDPALEGLAADDGSFTRHQWNRLEDVAADHHVQIVPEIDAPAHARSFIEFKPELGLDGGNSDHLDLTKPETTEFMKSVYDEFVPWFRSPVVHFGADEYPREYTAEYQAYFNTMSQHLRELGKQPAAWGSFSVMGGSAEGYDEDVVVNTWNDGWYGPASAQDDGYEWINTNDALLYIVPFANYYHGNGLDGAWLYDNWEPHVSYEDVVEPRAPGLQGAMSAVWNDLVHEDYDGPDVHGLVEPTFGLLAQKMWRGVEAGQTYEEFMSGVSRLGVGPGAEELTTTLFTPGDETLDATVEAPLVIPAGESATVTLTVRNRGDQRVAQTSAELPVTAAGLSVRRRLVGAKRLDPGQVTSWSWSITAGKDAGYSTTPTVVRMEGDRRGVPVFAARKVALRTVAPAPDGLEHLSYDARASASSVEADLPRLAADKANDGDPTTRWASNYTDDQWLQLELARPANVSEVELHWEEACATSYTIQVSTDGQDWTDAGSVTPESCGTDRITLDAPDPVRFVRMQGVDRASTYGYSIYEFRVFGTAD